MLKATFWLVMLSSASRIRNLRLRASAMVCRVMIGFKEEAGHTDDTVHGRADFVAHVSQEFTLGPVGQLGLLLGLTQGLFGLFPFGIE